MSARGKQLDERAGCSMVRFGRFCDIDLSHERNVHQRHARLAPRPALERDRDCTSGRRE